MDNNRLLSAALFLASMGVAVFPAKAGGKSPAFKGWQRASTTDAATIRAWWTQNPAFNVGVDMGKSGLFAVDYDNKNGKNGLARRAECKGPETWTVRTPHGGGLHDWYRGSADTKEGIYTGVDVRGRGGLVIAPPSVVDGVAYTWERPPVMYPLAEADSAVYTFIAPVPEGFDGQQRKEPYTVPEAIEQGQRTSALVALAGSLIGKGLTPAAAEAAIREENEARCNPPLTDDELTREVFPALHREKWQTGSTAPYTRDLPIDAALLEKLRAADPANSRRYGWNDAGAARLFMDVCGDCVQYAADRRRWLFYDGRRWDADGENAVKEKLKALADALTVYGLRDVADERRADFLKWAAKWQTLRQRETILKDAASVRPVWSSAFDRDAQVLNLQNGTLDLKTFTLKPHNAGDMLSRVAAVAYDPAATSPRWARFIDEITGGDVDTARYIQKAMGYALTGSTKHECLFMLYGATSRNGKSTLLETVAAMLGDYAANAKPESFTKQKYASGNQHSEDIARLAGARFVAVSEPPRGMELNAALVKSLTGRDTITARRLNEGSFEFTPAFKLYFNSNYRPRIDDMTVFESERIKLIPFNVHFGQDRRDPDLKDTLQTPDNLAGVLNWALDGLRLLRAEGFKMPPAVVQATDEYRRKMDKLLQFMDEKTETGAGYETPLMQLHSEFANWCNASGLMSVSIPKFRELLEERQILFKRKRPTDKTVSKNPTWMVLGLRMIQTGAGN